MKTNIGIFDSGIGGVTVLKECIKLNPNFNYYYYSDSINNPYGDKSQDEVIKMCEKIVKNFINKSCYIIIIACNTASAMAVSYLREKYKDIHFIAIEPAIKMVYDTSIDGTLIMATKGTLDSEKFNLLYDKYHHENFYLYSCVGLANLIEKGNYKEIVEYLNDNISKYKGKVSNVVLGCTHYPLIKSEIRDVLGNVTFYDGSNGIARRLRNIIEENNFIGRGKNISFIDSSNNLDKEIRFYRVLEEKNEEQC